MVRRKKPLLEKIKTAESPESLRGFEGIIARAYHESMRGFIKENVPEEMLPTGRSKRPPRDRYNAALSFLYSLLFRSVNQAIIAVGLEPAIGFFHTARSDAPPLVLDLMELFRVPLCDMLLVGSVNRLSWAIDDDFVVTKEKVWLSNEGRKKVIRLYESRLEDSWKHPAIGYSLSYYRLIELEVRLLEKVWTDKIELFATSRLR